MNICKTYFLNERYGKSKNADSLYYALEKNDYYNSIKTELQNKENVYRWKHRAMFLNNRMDEYLTLMVAGHELGHDVYHRELAKGDGMKEFELFRMQSSTEYEANAFAAHVLIDTDECLEYAREGYDVVQLAKAMNSEINLMLIKLQELSRLGYHIRVPFEPKSNFFKNIKA